MPCLRHIAKNLNRFGLVRLTKRVKSRTTVAGTFPGAWPRSSHQGGKFLLVILGHDRQVIFCSRVLRNRNPPSRLRRALCRPGGNHETSETSAQRVHTVALTCIISRCVVARSIAHHHRLSRPYCVKFDVAVSNATFARMLKSAERAADFLSQHAHTRAFQMLFVFSSTRC